MFQQPGEILLPSALIIETTNRCILRCPVCATPWNTARPQGEFPFTQFKKLVDSIDWAISNCDFGWSGEPFLNKDLLRMIAYCTEKGIFSHVATNGMFLDRDALEIVSCGLDSINVSLDGINQNMLEIYRVGADFSRIVRGVQKLVRVKRQVRSKHPYITLQMLIMKHTEKFIEEFKELGMSLGVDDVLLKSFNIEEGFWLDEISRQQMADKFIPMDRRFRRINDEHGGYSIAGQISEAKCSEVLTTPVILWDGRVSMCCVDFAATRTFGNINERQLNELWLSESYREFRQRAQQREWGICKRCLYPGSETFNERINVHA